MYLISYTTFFVIIIPFVVALVIFLAAAIVLVTAKLLKVKNATFSKALKITFFYKP